MQRQKARAMRAAPSTIGWSDAWQPHTVAHLEWPGQAQPLQWLGDTGEPACLELRPWHGHHACGHQRSLAWQRLEQPKRAGPERSKRHTLALTRLGTAACQ